MSQSSLFPEPSGDELAREAIARVEDHADGDWMRAAVRAVRRLAATGQPFTTDDVWPLLDSQDASTHERRAMGAVIRKLVAVGAIRKTGRYVKSNRAVCHSNPKAEWVGR